MTEKELVADDRGIDMLLFSPSMYNSTEDIEFTVIQYQWVFDNWWLNYIVGSFVLGFAAFMTSAYYVPESFYTDEAKK